jgi:hypothetical protein
MLLKRNLLEDALFVNYRSLPLKFLKYQLVGIARMRVVRQIWYSNF